MFVTDEYFDAAKKGVVIGESAKKMGKQTTKIHFCADAKNFGKNLSG